MRAGAGHCTEPRAWQTCCSPYWLPLLTCLAAFCLLGPGNSSPGERPGLRAPLCACSTVALPPGVRAPSKWQKNPQEAPIWHWTEERPPHPSPPRRPSAHTANTRMCKGSVSTRVGVVGPASDRQHSFPSHHLQAPVVPYPGFLPPPRLQSSKIRLWGCSGCLFPFSKVRSCVNCWWLGSRVLLLPVGPSSCPESRGTDPSTASLTWGQTAE